VRGAVDDAPESPNALVLATAVSLSTARSPVTSRSA
jgi:hypothetical protein